MAIITIEPLPPRVTKRDVIDLVCDRGEIEGRRIGRIELRGRQATVEVPDGWETRLVKALDGASFGSGRVRAWVVATSDGGSDGTSDHFRRLARLLDLESQAESQQAADRMRRLTASQAE